MLLLEGLAVMKPDIGLIFWTTLIFFVLWFIVGRYAIKPITEALRTRENSIETALKSAETARAEMAALQAKNEDLLIQAREERSQMLREAKQMQDKIIAEARERADVEYRRKVESAVAEIKNREMEMLTEVKNQSGKMALEIAEKVLRKELTKDAEQQAFANKLAQEMKLN
jgi:F-type H+-transporting ATPase subunit b